MLASLPGTLLIWLFATYLTFRKTERPPGPIVAWSKLKVQGLATGSSHIWSPARMITIKERA